MSIGREDYAERKEARIDRLESRAAKAQAESAAAYNTARSIMDHIPAGQPILFLIPITVPISNMVTLDLAHQVVFGWLPVGNHDLHMFITQEITLANVLATVTNARIAELLGVGPVMPFFMVSTHDSPSYINQAVPWYKQFLFL